MQLFRTLLLLLLLFSNINATTNIPEAIWVKDSTHTGKRPDCPFSKATNNQNYLWGTLENCKKKCIQESTGKCNMVSRYGETSKLETDPYHCRFYECPDTNNFTWITQDQWGNYANECNTYIMPIRHYTIESRYQNVTQYINQTRYIDTIKYTPYQIKEPGTNSCPTGFSQIKNIDECKTAQEEVASDKSFQGIPHPEHPVSGCYYDTLHNRVYMPPDTHGIGHNHMTPICKATCENIINNTIYNYINITRWINSTRLINQTQIINKTNCIDKLTQLDIVWEQILQEDDTNDDGLIEYSEIHDPDHPVPQQMIDLFDRYIGHDQKMNKEEFTLFYKHFMDEQQNPTPPPCTINSCADCHFNDVCTNAGCKWNDTVIPNGAVPWCTQIKTTKINWINKTNTRWINKTNIRWIDKFKIRWINKTNTIWIDKFKIRWINKTHWYYKTNITTKIKYIQNKEQDISLKNATNEEWSIINIVALSGAGLFGLCMMSILFYVTWHCFLKDKIQDIIIKLCCGDCGEYFLSCWEFIGCIRDWKGQLEERKDANEFDGLNEKQINVIKEARDYNQLRYDEAVKLVWEKTCAIIKRNQLQNEAFKRQIELQQMAVKDEEPEQEDDEKTTINILPGTPRKRIPRKMEI